MARLQFRRKLLLAALLVGALTLFLVTEPLYPEGSLVRSLMFAAGVGLVGAAVYGRLWAALHIGGRKKREIVETGPYAATRNPLYIASLLGIAGLGLSLGSFLLTLLGTLAAFLVFDRLIRKEEDFLEGQFGATYRAYCARVPRWVPERLPLPLGGEIGAVDEASVLRTLREALLLLVALGAEPLLALARGADLLPVLFRLP